MEPGV